MSRVMHVWPQPARKTGSLLEIEAVLDCEGFDRHMLWYRMPESQVDLLSHSADSFAIAAVFVAMRNADKLHVHGQVSPSLLGNLMEFQRAWSRWYPGKYRVVDILVDNEEEEKCLGNARSVMAFSGGLDSCFTAWRHTRGRSSRLRENIGAGLMVHGFDIPISDTDAFIRAFENSRYLLESVGLDPLIISTNFRDLKDNWEDAHGAGILSALHLLKGGFKGGVVASSHSYEAMRVPWGSNPITDPLLSSVGFQVSHDGCGFTRRQKAGVVAAWPEAMKGLRICWEGAEKDRNCGVCLRCVATAMCFELEGVPLPASLPVLNIASAVDNLGRKKLPPVALARLSELLADAENEGLTLPWLNALRRLIVSKKGRIYVLKSSGLREFLKSFK